MTGPMVLLSTADTEILAAAHAVGALPAGFHQIRCANPLAQPELADELTARRPGVVVCRLLGGRRAWPEGVATLRERSLAEGWPLLLLGGEAEPDAELTALSTAPAATVAEGFEYLRHGGVENTAHLFRFLADTVLLEGHGFDGPRPLPECSAWSPADGDLDVAAAVARLDPARPTVGIVFYRSHRATGNTEFVAALARAVEEAGANALCAWTYSLRPDSGGRVPALDILGEHVDSLITTVLASGGANAGDLDAGWRAQALENLGIPVIQALCVTVPRERWADSDGGLTPLDGAMQVAIPELDGRIIGVPVSFKEPLTDQEFEIGTEVLHYAPDLERCARLARLAVRHARLRHVPAEQARIAIMLSSFPTKHGRVGNAVGLDTPASAVALLAALREQGYDVGEGFDDGDELIHALVAAGGHDQEFLTDAQLAGAQARLPVDEYAAWFNALPESLRRSVEETWGPAPGEWYLDRDELVIAGLQLGNVFLAIQPPRGYGENPVAIYHDPALAPAHHYLAAYVWIERNFGADAIVHLGKHGTLEWLPGKALGLSDGCAPDAAIGDTPFFYPFVVNDPGEGVQAKRRTHAVIVDHLVAPMMRAETYDELAELEVLLDEYARCAALDPPKLPALATRIWTVLHEAQLHRDLGIEHDDRPELDEFSELIGHIDGYLCEIKDLQVRDGLHVLGRPPQGEQFDGLLAAILRLGAGDEIPGLRRALAAAYDLDEPAMASAPQVSADAPRELVDRFPGPHRTNGELIDRLEDAQRALLAQFADAGHDPGAARSVCSDALGLGDRGVERVLRYAGEELVPKLSATEGEIPSLIGGLQGRHVPAGASGSPTRGRHDVLPTGRNFYSVDPKALPSELAYETGARLADALLERQLAEQGSHPESVGIVVWGTAAMRTHGDDAGEVLALLGVRPVWHQETRRITDLEPISLDELGRPRIDVTLRISGFFRDAFPSLVALLDDAVTLVAGLDEPLERNFVRKHVLEDVARLSDELGLEPDAARRRATMRVFGAPPGSYGTGLLPLLDAGNWRDDADLAAVYEAWGGHAYGRGLEGVQARSAMREQFARIQVAVKNVDSREHDLLDSGDYFAEHGGMIAFVRHLTGSSPDAAIGDSTDPQRARARGLDEESRRVFRARVANPRWIASMIRHGYKGAFELSATVDYLFGYDATTGVVEDWMYETLAAKYVLDDDVREFMGRSNPWALRAVAERLLEAADRQLWQQPDPQTLEALRAAYLEVEGELEEATS